MTHSKQTGLLQDEEIESFIRNGYHICTPDVSPVLHARVAAQIAAVLARDSRAFDDHTLRGEMRPTPADPTANSNDIFMRLPALAEVCSTPNVCGALTSLCGRGYQMQVHRHVHFKPPWKGETVPEMPVLPRGLHQDGRFRTLFGWNRFMRYPYLPVRIIAFYYPEGVTAGNGVTQIVPGSHWVPELCPDMLRHTISLTVPPGSFVLLHSALFHRGTPEMIGKRRIMIKLNFDRTESPPRSPSWKCSDKKRAIQDPEVERVWKWMAAVESDAGNTPRKADGEGLKIQLDRVVAVDVPPQERMRAAFEIGRSGTEELVERLLTALPTEASEAETATPVDRARSGWAHFSSFSGWGVATAVSACAEKATVPLLRAIAAATGRRKALLLDLLMDCDNPQHRKQRLDCFVNCLDDPEEWVRHTAVQAMEVCSQSLRDHGYNNRPLLPLLEHYVQCGGDRVENDFVVWTAVSAARYAASPNTVPDLVRLLQPLQHHASPFLSWKAACTIHELRTVAKL